MFSAKHSFADMRECNLKQTKNLTKIGGGFPECEKVFFGSFFGFWWFCFVVSLCFCAFAFYTIAQNGCFPAFAEVFCPFCSHKRPVFDCLFSSYFVFCFVFPFKNPFFLWFLSINPFLEKILCGVSFVFLLLAFSFPNVCMFI